MVIIYVVGSICFVNKLATRSTNKKSADVAI